MDLSICIVNWNTGGLLRDCVRSIIENTETDEFEVIVVDNGSSDDSVELLKQACAGDDQIRIIDLKRNVGFAAGNNVAIAYASGRVVCLLNPDTLVTPGALDKAVEMLDAHPNWGVLGPKLLNSDGSLQPSVGNFPTLSGMFWEMTRLRKLFPDISLFSSFKRMDMDYSMVQEVEQPSGACLFVRRTAIDQVGLLDTRFFMYFEEVDWCYRFAGAGWRIVYTPDIEIVHLGGQSSSKNLDVRIVENSRSKIRFFQKHYAHCLLVLLALRVIVIAETTMKMAALALELIRRPSSRAHLTPVATRYLQVISMALGNSPV